MVFYSLYISLKSREDEGCKYFSLNARNLSDIFMISPNVGIGDRSGGPKAEILSLFRIINSSLDPLF